MKECPRCLMTDDIAKIGTKTSMQEVEVTSKGKVWTRIETPTQCEYCDLHDRLESEFNPAKIQEWVDMMRLDGIDKQYDCLIGVSGGFDSSLLWHLAVKHWGLRPLVLHFDNGQNEPFAARNIERMEQHLGTKVMWVKPQNQMEYDDAVQAMLRSNTPDADIVNDIYMTKLMYEVALKHRIHWILNGHDYRTEGSTPRPWTRLDSGYLANIYRKFNGRRLPSEYRLTMLDQIRYGWHGIRNIRPYYHLNVDRPHFESLLKQQYNWTGYDLKHGENRYTAWAGYELLPKKFGIDKRRVYLSAQIRSHIITKQEAVELLKAKVKVKYPSMVYGLVKEMVLNSKPMPRSVYKQTNYKRWRLVVWLLVKANILPYTFYAKYCKG